MRVRAIWLRSPGPEKPLPGGPGMSPEVGLEMGPRQGPRHVPNYSKTREGGWVHEKSRKQVTQLRLASLSNVMKLFRNLFLNFLKSCFYFKSLERTIHSTERENS